MLGYPRGDNGGALLYPLVRKGVVANIRDFVSGLAFKAALAITSAKGDSGGIVLAQPANSNGELRILGMLVTERVVEDGVADDTPYGISDIVLAEVVENHIRKHGIKPR